MTFFCVMVSFPDLNKGRRATQDDFSLRSSKIFFSSPSFLLCFFFSFLFSFSPQFYFFTFRRQLKCDGSLVHQIPDAGLVVSVPDFLTRTSVSKSLCVSESLAELAKTDSSTFHLGHCHAVVKQRDGVLFPSLIWGD